MHITFDPSKSERNEAEHGLPLSAAEGLEWDALMAKPDTRREYGEARMIGYAPINGRLYCVVYVDRDDARRVISLRKANNREIDRYEQEAD